ncbi:hypothetical protein Ancab_033625 [Ancistrocladus abbreviatus]
MEEPYASETVNGEGAEKDATADGVKRRRHFKDDADYGEESLYDVVKGMLWSIFSPDHTSGLAGTSLYHRTKTSFQRDLPGLRDASKTSGCRIMRWTRQGSPLRALLVISVSISVDCLCVTLCLSILLNWMKFL